MCFIRIVKLNRHGCNVTTVELNLLYRRTRCLRGSLIHSVGRGQTLPGSVRERGPPSRRVGSPAIAGLQYLCKGSNVDKLVLKPWRCAVVRSQNSRNGCVVLGKCRQQLSTVSFVRIPQPQSRRFHQLVDMMDCRGDNNTMETSRMQLNRVGSYSQSGGRVSPGSDQQQCTDNTDAFPREADQDFTGSVPVYVMLPLDTVNADGVYRYASAQWFSSALCDLKQRGIHGVAVDVWWGAVEKKPRVYDFSGYRQLFEFLVSLELKIQVVLAFHACGGNVGDNAEVPLPSWVLAAGERDPDIFFTDRPREFSPGNRNPECISLFADDEPGILRGRSPIQCYVDFMKAFRDEFVVDSNSLIYDAITEISLGTGPCGELRYPSYAETNGWRFPGIGEFQCYDRRALASLATAAEDVGHPEWGHAGPPDVGHYNSIPDDTSFFRGWDGTWSTEYGKFFLDWYCRSLLDHGERMLQAASLVFHIIDSRSETSEKMERSGEETESLNDFVGISGEPSPREKAQSPLQRQNSTPGGLRSRGPSYASFKSSTSISEGLNSMEEWSWPSPSGKAINMNLKIAGVHWWYHTKSHAAELTAGYNGYNGIIALCAKYGVSLTLTCVEMCDSQHPPEVLCGPEGLLREVKEAAFAAGVPLAGENALPCFMPNAIDESALQRIVYNTQPLGTPLEEGRGGNDDSMHTTSSSSMSIPEVTEYSTRFLPPMKSFTFLRLTPEMMSDSYQKQWNRFMKLMSRNALRFKTSERWRRDLGFE